MTQNAEEGLSTTLGFRAPNLISAISYDPSSGPRKSTDWDELEKRLMERNAPKAKQQSLL
jgi:hypothetical protein